MRIHNHVQGEAVKVYSADGETQVLGDVLARGGEGAVHPLVSRPEVLVKLYHPDVLAKRGAELPRKVEAMTARRTAFDDMPVCWPLISVYNAAGTWTGYAMYRAEGVPMMKLAHSMLYQKYFPGLDRRRLADYVLAFVETIARLHERDVFVGDYNLNNIMCSPTTGKVTLIDCDSFQMQHEGKVYPCPVGSMDMTPAELMGRDFKTVRRTVESERFSVAIVLFKALMLGRHPYDAIGGENPVDNIRAGNFPYGRETTGRPKGPWHNIWSHMPYRLKQFFIQTFTEGARDPAQRATLEEWMEALRLYRAEIDKGWHEVAIRPERPKSKAYRGTQSIEVAGESST